MYIRSIRLRFTRGILDEETVIGELNSVIIKKLTRNIKEKFTDITLRNIRRKCGMCLYIY